MIPATSPKEKLPPGSVKNPPCISVIMPFEPKMASKLLLADNLDKAVNVVKTQLEKEHPAFIADLLIKKLKALIASVDYSTYKRSIVIFLSSGIEKIYYLDIEVQEKIIINDSFEIRDIVLNKQLKQEYLLLVLSNKKEKIFLGNGKHLTPLVINNNKNIAAIKNDVAEKVANFSDPQHRKELLIKKCLKHIDNGLDLLLKSYPLPIIVTCTKKTMGYFKQISKNVQNIIEYIPGNYERASVSELEILLEDYLADWQRIKEKNLLQIIEEATGKHKCVCGIKEVYKEAAKRGRLLIVEENFIYPALKGEDNELNPAESSFTNSVYTKDAVDDIIEQVLQDGGNVEFVKDGVLKDYDRIALILYY